MGLLPETIPRKKIPSNWLLIDHYRTTGDKFAHPFTNNKKYGHPGKKCCAAGKIQALLNAPDRPCGFFLKFSLGANHF